jgi:subtilisin family serine protease
VTDVLETQEAAPPAWVREELGGATGRGIRVAVVDSGWDRSIGDDRVLPGVGFVDPDDDFALARNDDDQDVLGHGTACADVILSVAPDARIVPVKVFGKVLETSPGTLRAALLWAIEEGVQVINVSLGTRLEGTLHPLYHACEMARQAGIIIVAAGHNANDWSYPAIFENVIGVSAAKFDSPYHFRYRPEHAMECEAWGVERPVLWIGGERVVRHGTSFAAPSVAGIVAMILERHPGATLEQVREMLSRFALSVDLTPDSGTADEPSSPRQRARRTAAGARPQAAAAKKTASASKSRKAAAPAQPKAEKAVAAKPKAEKTAGAKAKQPASAAPGADRAAPARRAAEKAAATTRTRGKAAAERTRPAPAAETEKTSAAAGAKARKPASAPPKVDKAAPAKRAAEKAAATARTRGKAAAERTRTGTTSKND